MLHNARWTNYQLLLLPPLIQGQIIIIIIVWWKKSRTRWPTNKVLAFLTISPTRIGEWHRKFMPNSFPTTSRMIWHNILIALMVSMVNTKCSLGPPLDGMPKISTRSFIALMHSVFPPMVRPTVQSGSATPIGLPSKKIAWCTAVRHYTGKGSIRKFGAHIGRIHLTCSVVGRLATVGSNGNIEFERGVKEQISPHCEIHTFDIRGRNKRAGWVESKKRVSRRMKMHFVETFCSHVVRPFRNFTEALQGYSTFHQWGIGTEEQANAYKQRRKGHPVKTLAETMQELGHANRTIHVFKIDCEWYVQ